jgi:hypothetical protein
VASSLPLDWTRPRIGLGIIDHQHPFGRGRTSSNRGTTIPTERLTGSDQRMWVKRFFGRGSKPNIRWVPNRDRPSSIEITVPRCNGMMVPNHSLRTKFVNPVTTKVISPQPATMWSHR